MFAFVVLCLVSSLLAKRLAGKNVSEVTYQVGISECHIINYWILTNILLSLTFYQCGGSWTYLLSEIVKLQMTWLHKRTQFVEESANWRVRRVAVAGRTPVPYRHESHHLHTVQTIYILPLFSVITTWYQSLSSLVSIRSNFFRVPKTPTLRQRSNFKACLHRCVGPTQMISGPGGRGSPWINTPASFGCLIYTWLYMLWEYVSQVFVVVLALFIYWQQLQFITRIIYKKLLAKPRSTIPVVAELLFLLWPLNFHLWPWPSNLT